MGYLIPICLLTDWKNFVTNCVPLSVTRYVRIPNVSIQWSKNIFATCDAVVFDIGIALVNVE